LCYRLTCTCSADAVEYREQVKQTNKEVFEKEKAERDKMRMQANYILQLVESNPALLRSKVEWMQIMSDEEIKQKAIKMLRYSDSAHPIDGFWDSHGRIVNENKKGTHNAGGGWTRWYFLTFRLEADFLLLLSPSVWTQKRNSPARKTLK
jgi:hypothetical protein